MFLLNPHKHKIIFYETVQQISDHYTKTYKHTWRPFMSCCSFSTVVSTSLSKAQENGAFGFLELGLTDWGKETLGSRVHATPHRVVWPWQNSVVSTRVTPTSCSARFSLPTVILWPTITLYTLKPSTPHHRQTYLHYKGWSNQSFTIANL